MLKDIVGLRNEKIEIKEDVGSKHFPKPTSRKRRVIRIQCDCGVSKEILYENFKKTKSCGCSKQIEVPIGKKYGRLIITKDLGRGYIEGSKTKARHVECVCECGKRIQT